AARAPQLIVKRPVNTLRQATAPRGRSARSWRCRKWIWNFLVASWTQSLLRGAADNDVYSRGRRALSGILVWRPGIARSLDAIAGDPILNQGLLYGVGAQQR